MFVIANLELKDTKFLESLKNPKRRNQIGNDQRRAIMFTYKWIVPQLKSGNRILFISHKLVQAETGCTKDQAREVLRRLRKDFLTIKRLPGRGGTVTVYTVNFDYIKPVKQTQGELYRLWHLMDHNDVKFASCLSYLHANGKKATYRNLLLAEEKFERGEIVKLKPL